MKKYSAILLFLFAAIVSHARLGETEPELVARFGDVRSRMKATVVDGTQGRVLIIGEELVFETDGWQIRAVIIDGRCARIGYQNSGPWNEDQLRYLLNTYGGRDRWKEQSPPSKAGAMKSNRRWKRDDGLVAAWNGAIPASIGGSVFSITGDAYTRAVERAQQAKRAEDKKIPKF